MKITRCFLLAGSLALTAVFALPGLAVACALDNTGSLSANGSGDQNNLNSSPNSPGYVPFLFPRVYGSDQGITFSENFADLRKSLSQRELARPFLWTWGDGSHSTSFTPHHAYRRSGTYVISVYAATPSDTGTWTPFDKVSIRVVPPGEVWRDNLGQDFLDFLNIAVVWGGRGLLGLIIIGLAIAFGSEYLRKKARKVKPPQTPSRDGQAGAQT